MDTKETIPKFVLRDAGANVVFFVVGTIAILAIGSWSRSLGIVLAAIEAVFAALQSFKALVVIAGSVALFFLVLFGKCERQADESEMRLTTLIRLVELAIWLSCLFVLYRFFYGHHAA